MIMSKWLNNKLDGGIFNLVVFESFDDINKSILLNYIRNSVPIYLIEPLVAYHKESNTLGFSSTFPSYVESLLRKGVLELIPAEMIEGKNIYMLAADKAVGVIESVFPEYRREHEDLFKYVSVALKSPMAENAFKKDLCDRLAKFYSVNIMLHRIEKKLGPHPILVYPDTNVRTYLYLKDLLLRSNQAVFEHPNTYFSRRIHVAAFSENLKNNLIAVVRLFAQVIISGLLNGFNTFQRKKKRSYSYGVTVVSPSRQLRGNERGPNFIIDNNKILTEDVVFFPLVDLTGDQKNRLAEMYGEVYMTPKAGRFFSHFKEWKKLLWLTIKKNFLRNGEEVNVACVAFFNYFKWLRVMENVKLRHFITHCDFGINHVGRNLALNQWGVQTWYFTDSMNFGCNIQDKNKKNSMRHPFWTYLNYDHFVTWNNFLAQYFKDHPGHSKQSHVVGCLWSGYIKEKNIAKERMVKFNLINRKNDFIIVAFDTTYSRNGFASYTEGVAFAEHILKLADDFAGIQIFLKEKKDRSFHKILDPINGPKLANFYHKISLHNRISTFSDKVDRIIGSNEKTTNESSKVDTSELISSADMVVSFPFTSTTFEALSANKPAIWHDPMGYYRDTVYGSMGSVTTHSYEELKAMVLEFKEIRPNAYQNPIPKNSPLMDPYMDGNAIDRFRDLLIS